MDDSGKSNGHHRGLSLKGSPRDSSKGTGAIIVQNNGERAPQLLPAAFLREYRIVVQHRHRILLFETI